MKKEFVRKYIKKMIVRKDKEKSKSFYITFEYTKPIISPQSEYRYEFHNQKCKKIYRINADGTEDWIY